jgi:hypothetical protein
MPFIPTIFWCYSHFYLNLLSITKQDKSADKHHEYARFDETNSSFSELLNERAEKKERRGKHVKN